MNRFFSFSSFALPALAGLAAVAWVGAGYAGSHPLALAVTVVIGAFFLLGVGELTRFRQGTHSLAQALDRLNQPVPVLADWLAGIDPALRQSVRQRVEGTRSALPTPALTPYLAGLLVLLGMLGTFAGMVVTLRGTGLALEGASDLAAVRASLAAPVKGLGVAFGTSLAGVATSAMLGLLSALARRERLQASQQLDSAIAGALRIHSPIHQREQSFALMQRQAEALPQLAERLQTLAAQLEQQHGAAQERLLASQERFHQQAEVAYTGLATSVGQALNTSLADGARAAGAALQPAVEATLAGLAREAQALQERVSASVQQHLDSLAQRFDTHQSDVARHWQQALAGQQQTHAALTDQLQGALADFAHGFEGRSTALLGQIGTQLASTTGQLAERGQALLAQQAGASQAHADALQRQLTDTSAQFAEQTRLMTKNAEQALLHLREQLSQQEQERRDAWQTALAQLATQLQQQWQHTAADGARQQQAVLTALAETTQAVSAQSVKLASTTDQLAERGQALLAQQAGASQAHADALQRQLTNTTAQFAEQTRLMTENAQQSALQLREQLSKQEQERQDAWQTALSNLASQLEQQWQRTGADGTRQHQAMLTAMAETAQTMGAQSASQAQSTIGEIGRVLDAAAAAPRAAAEVMDQLRDKLSQSMARDNAMLDERARLLDTVGTLLERVNHASTEQRQAITQLVDGSAQLLERSAARFDERLQADGNRLADAAAQISAGATEIASLGDAFGQAVQAFGASNAQLGGHLQQLDATLAQTITRSDEQLAYYVAQAREVIELSLTSQQHIVGELQRLARERAAEGAAA